MALPDPLRTVHIFLIDVSGSMWWGDKWFGVNGLSLLTTAKSSVINMINYLKNEGQGDLIVIRFNTEQKLVIPPKDISEFNEEDESKINALVTYGDTALYDGIDYCKKFFKLYETPSGAKYEVRLYVFTDGKDTKSDEKKITEQLKDTFAGKSLLDIVSLVYIVGDDAPYITGGNNDDDNGNDPLVFFIPMTNADIAVEKLKETNNEIKLKNKLKSNSKGESKSNTNTNAEQLYFPPVPTDTLVKEKKEKKKTLAN